MAVILFALLLFVIYCLGDDLLKLLFPCLRKQAPSLTQTEVHTDE